MPTMNRRTLLQIAGASFGGAALPAMPLLARLPSLIAETHEGPVRGAARGQSIAFFGIPFAAPPVGPLRFRAPQPPARRAAVLDAASFAAAPIQNPPPEGLYGAGPLPTSENCLALNIWRPVTPGPHPVYVWVHGGGNVAGSSRMPVFDGERFARHGIVCVTISYRVGMFGFLDVGSLLGAAYAGSGNNGLLDIVRALEWVRDNIAGFGGNPATVTLGGQSAGAKNVCTLLAMPSAKGLFRAAIVESGGAETAATPQRAAEMAATFLSASGFASARELLTADAPALLAAQNRFARRWNRKYPFRAVVDGTLLPELPLHALRAGRAWSIPLLIGTTRDEIAFFGPNAGRDGTVIQGDLANMALEMFEPVYRGYDAALPDRSPIDRRYAALTAEEYGIPTIHAADAHAHAGHPVWVYRLDMPRAEAPNAGYAVHGSELPLVWSKLDDHGSALLGPEGPAAQRLSDLMHGHWVRFIRTGQVAPTWSRYTMASRTTMLFDGNSRMVDDPDARLRLLWDGARFDFS